MDVNTALKTLADAQQNSRASKAPIAGSKRPFETTEQENNDDKDADDDSSSDDDEPEPIKWTCGQVRNKINTYLKSGEMKVGEFQNKLGVSSGAYLRFMRQTGAQGGMYTDTYSAAHRFFSKRERKGIKMPRAKKPKPTPADPSKYDISGIELPGEDEDAVEIYDTCDDMRKKINAHLSRADVTRASLLRELGKMYHSGRTIQSKQLGEFLKKKGPTAGNTSSVFYSSYVYFEKLRIKNNSEKSKKRLEMEKIHRKGMDTERLHTHFLGRPGDIAYEDEYGRFHIERQKK